MSPSKKYLLSLIQCRSTKRYTQVDGQTCVNDAYMVHFKNSSMMFPIKLEKLSVDILEEILDSILTDQF